MAKRIAKAETVEASESATVQVPSPVESKVVAPAPQPVAPEPMPLPPAATKVQPTKTDIPEADLKAIAKCVKDAPDGSVIYCRDDVCCGEVHRLLGDTEKRIDVGVRPQLSTPATWRVRI